MCGGTIGIEAFPSPRIICLFGDIGMEKYQWGDSLRPNDERNITLISCLISKLDKIDACHPRAIYMNLKGNRPISFHKPCLLIHGRHRIGMTWEICPTS